MAYRDLIDDEDVVVYSTIVMTEEQVEEGTYTPDCLTIDSDTFNEAKGVAKGALQANEDYVYAIVIEAIYNYDYDGTLVFNNSQLVYSVWASKTDSRFKQSKETNKNYS